MSQAEHPVPASTDRLPMADTHHHLWDLSRFRYDWLMLDGDPGITDFLGEYGPIRVDYLIDELKRDYEGAGIVKSIHVQADVSEPDPVVETAWLQDLSDRHGFPHAIVAYSDLRSDDVAHDLDRHLGFAGMRGIRMPDEVGLLSDPAFRRGVAAMAERGLSLQADTPVQRMPELASLADAFPRMTFVLGHTGLPEERAPEYLEAWRSGIARIAERHNVVVKISGLGMRDHTWTVESIRPYALEAIEAFGVGRCMFGTNWPVDRLYSDLPTLVDAYRAIIARSSTNEQRDLLLHNAERFYRI